VEAFLQKLLTVQDLADLLQVKPRSVYLMAKGFPRDSKKLEVWGSTWR